MCVIFIVFVKIDLRPWDIKGDYQSLIIMGDSLENFPSHRSTDFIVGILENEKCRSFWQNFIKKNWLIDHPGFVGMKLGVFEGHSGVIFNQDSQHDVIATFVKVLDILHWSVVGAKDFGVRQFFVGQSSDFGTKFIFFFLARAGLNGDKCHDKWQNYL